MKAIFAAIALLAAAAPAQAGEVFGGLYVHGVDTPLTLGGSPEGGIDLQAGYRGDPIGGENGAQPYVFGSLNSAGDTHFLAAGFAWTFGQRVYVRPGLGLAVHSGSARNTDQPGNSRIEFGSRILFEPELAIGTRINERMSVEASWVHLSHGGLFGRQNPGLDTIGARFNWKL
ncbi:acyloxyacyl hydrolase [Sphingomonas mesophila]|uniref:acyloxyacyl hydrolase n=1 Tax=Sphingomonas mesophila TaxID=2303576 RepID=UPI000E57C5E0|nr:acyloxyacyl hydrolase [Sphingomonas mesophila]